MNGIAVAQSTNDKVHLAYAQRSLSRFYSTLNIDYVKGLDWGLKALHTAEQSNDVAALAGARGNMANAYLALADNTTSLIYNERAFEANRRIGHTASLVGSLMNKGNLYSL